MRRLTNSNEKRRNSESDASRPKHSVILVFGQPDVKRRVKRLLEEVMPREQFRVLDMPHLEDKQGEMSAEGIEAFYAAFLGLEYGISLLVHCVQEKIERFSEKQQRESKDQMPFLDEPDTYRMQWNLCYKIVCKKTVPVVLIVQGRNPDISGAQWWSTPSISNSLRRLRIHPHGVCYMHAAEEYQELRLISPRFEEQNIREEIRRVCSRVHRKPWEKEKTRWMLKVPPNRSLRNEGVKGLVDLCEFDEEGATELGEQLESMNNEF